MDRKYNTRTIVFPILFAAMSFSSFIRSAGSENIRGVQILRLIATGMLLGVALANTINYYKENKNN